MTEHQNYNSQKKFKRNFKISDGSGGSYPLYAIKISFNFPFAIFNPYSKFTTCTYVYFGVPPFST